MNVDDVEIVGATPEEIIERVESVLRTQLHPQHDIHGKTFWSCGLPGYPTTWISVSERSGEDGEPDYWDVNVAPRPPIDGQAVATMIFRAVTKDTDWEVTQWSDAFGIVAKRPPHRRRSRFRWEPGLFMPVPKPAQESPNSRR